MATQPNTVIGRKTNREWYATSGLPDAAPASAVAYAQRLVRYISDASTVRARVLDEFSAAPPLEKIRRWRQEWNDLVASRAGRLDDYDEARGLDAENDDAAAVGDVIVMRAGRRVKLPVPSVRESAALKPPAVVRPAVPRVSKAPPLTHVEVIEQCAVRFRLTRADIVGRSRTRRVVRARQFAATLLRARGASYPQIGRWLGGFDHSTTIHAVKTFFTVGIADPAYEAGWMAMAPCATKMARSVAELDMLVVPRG